MTREDTRVIIQGFGNVGSNAALLMHDAGYKIIGIGEWDGGLYNANGIDIDALWEYRQKQRHHPRLQGRRDRRTPASC